MLKKDLEITLNRKELILDNLRQENQQLQKYIKILESVNKTSTTMTIALEKTTDAVAHVLQNLISYERTKR